MKCINLTFSFNRWVLYKMTAEDKRKRKVACFTPLRNQRRKHFAQYCDPWVKIGVLQRWKPKRSAISTWRITSLGCKWAITNKKILFCIWWDFHRIIRKLCMKREQNIKSAIYILIKFVMPFKQKEETRSEERWFCFINVTAEHMLVQKLELDLMHHQTCRPDMSLSYFYLFSHVYLNVYAIIFNSND